MNIQGEQNYVDLDVDVLKAIRLTLITLNLSILFP